MTTLKTTLHQFPYPIAANVDRLLREMEKPARSHTIEFFILIDIFESILKYLSLITISNYIEKGPRDKRLDEIVKERFLGRPLSLGGWEDLLKTVLRYYRTRPGDFFIPPLVDFYFRRGGSRVRMTKEAQQFKGFISIRNEKLAHGGLKLESEYKTLVEEYLPLMERLLQKLSFLESFELMIPLFSSGEMELLRCQGLALESESMPASLEIGTDRRENPLLWKRDDPSQYMLLYPLLLAELGRSDGEDDLFFYEKNRRQARDSSKLQTLEYLGVRYKKHLKLREGDSYQPLMSTFQNRLSPWMEKAREMVDLSGPLYGFSEIQAILKEYSSPFYGREELVQNILGEVQKGEGGYLLITGEPGSGKTALLAFLAKQLPQGLYHFLSPGANQVERWLQALFEQLVKIYPSEGPVPTDKERVLQEFWEKAARIAEVEPLVIFLDALDELSDRDGHSLFFLPKQLPPGLFVILSSRFGSIRERTLSRFALRELQLPPLNQKVVSQWCLRDLGEKTLDDSEIHQLMMASQGNPLYIRFYLKCLQSQARIEMGDDLKNLFEERLSQIIDEMDEEVVLGLLGLLTVSRSGFSRRDLAEIMGMNQLRVGKALRKLSEFVVEREEVYYLFHRTFREYARDRIFTSSDLKNHHLRIAHHYQNWEREVREYGLNHLSYHFFHSQDYLALLDLLKSGFLCQKADHFCDPLAAEEDLIYGIQAGLALKNPLVMAQFALERAFLVRAVKSLSRSGLLPLFAGLGEIQKSLNLTHRLSDPEERSRSLIQIALQLAPSYPGYALSLMGEISEFSLRKEGALKLAERVVEDPVPFLEPILNDPELDEISPEDREKFLIRALPLLGRHRPGWGLRLLEGLSLSGRASVLSQGADGFVQGPSRENWKDQVEGLRREIEGEGQWEVAPNLVIALALMDFRQAREWVEKIPSSEKKKEALAELGLVAVRRNRRKGAEEILKILPPSEGRNRLLTGLALMISEDLDQARGLIDEIDDPHNRFEGRLKLLKKHPSPSLFGDARKDLEALASTTLEQQAIRDLARIWVGENPVEASDLVRDLQDEPLRISALRDLGLKLLEGSPERAREFLTLSSHLAILTGDRSARARVYGAIGGALPPSHQKEACELLKKALTLTETEPVGMRQPFAAEVISEVALRNIDRALELSKKLPEPVSRALALSESAKKIWDVQPDQGEKLLQAALDLINQLDSEGDKTRLLSGALPLLARRDPGGAYDKTLLMEASTTRRETVAEILGLYSRTNFPRARKLWEGEKDSTTRLVSGVAILQVLLEDNWEEAFSLFDQLFKETLGLSEIQEKLYGLSRLRPLASSLDSIREREVEEHLRKITDSLKKEDQARAERMVAQQGLRGKKASVDLVEDSLNRLQKSLHLDVSYRAVREARERMVRALLHQPVRQRMEEAILLAPEMDDLLLGLFPLLVRVISLLSDHSADLLFDLLGYLEGSSKDAMAILSGSTLNIQPWEEAACAEHTPLSHSVVDQHLQEEAEGEGAPIPDEDLLSIQREMGKAGEADLMRLKEIYLQRGDQGKALEILQDLAALMEKEGKTERAKNFYEEIISLDPDHPQALGKLKKALPPISKPKPAPKITGKTGVELEEKPKGEARKVSEKEVTEESKTKESRGGKDKSDYALLSADGGGGGGGGGEAMDELMDEPSSGEGRSEGIDDLIEGPSGKPGEVRRGLETEFPTPVPHKKPEGEDISGYGSYQILQQIGRGGMGEVFLVQDEGTRKMGVMKVVAGLDQNQWRALENCLRTFSATLIHPQIMEILGWGEGPEGNPFIVLESFEGQSLDQIMRNVGVLPKSQALSITSQISQALQFLHSQGVIFQALTPADIFISGAGEVKLDISKILYSSLEQGGEGLTRVGALIGRPDYLSPEQITGDPVDHRSDLYSLGYIFFEMITGKKPFVADSVPVILSAKIQKDPPSPSEVNPSLGCDEPLESFTRMALEIKKDFRFQSAEEFGRACEDLLSPPPPPARESGPVEYSLPPSRPSGGKVPAPSPKAPGKSAMRASSSVPQRFNLAPAEYQAKRRPSIFFMLFNLIFFLILSITAIYFIIRWFF